MALTQNDRHVTLAAQAVLLTGLVAAACGVAVPSTKLVGDAVSTVGSGGGGTGNAAGGSGGSGGTSGSGGAGGSAGSGGAGGSAGAGGGMEQIDSGTPIDMPGQMDAAVVDLATTPKTEDGRDWTGPGAPLLAGVQVVPNRDSVTIVVPAVSGVVDYRAYRLPAGSTVLNVDGGTQVNGTAIHCAGYRQRNARFTGTRELMRVIEVTGLLGRGPALDGGADGGVDAGPADGGGTFDIVVEAIDTACPFPGLMGSQHQDIQVSTTQVPTPDRVRVSFYTDAEIRARYGSLIVNGQGKAAVLGQQGPIKAPRVLARTTVRVNTQGTATPRTKDFFDDFGDATDRITYVRPMHHFFRVHEEGRRFRNSKWDFFVYNDQDHKADLWIDRGMWHVTLPDWEQDVFTTAFGVPRRPAMLSDTNYLHLTFEVASNATSRRYWWVGVCGAPQPGQTFAADGGGFAGNLIQTSFFYQEDGLNTSLERWNCLQFFPRDGSPFPLPPSNTRTESDIRVMINRPDAGMRNSVVNLSPAQYDPVEAAPSWFRQQGPTGPLAAPVLDDQMLVAPRTRFDAWIRRDRFVLYVNGQQRICNDFPNHRLSMAEAAVAFGQVIYHSAAERLEFSQNFNDRTGQRHYLENAPYADQRDWDNVGFEEDMPTPTPFDSTRCYVHR